MAVCARCPNYAAQRFREDLCLDAGELIEAAEGVVTPTDPLSGAAAEGRKSPLRAQKEDAVSIATCAGVCLL
jgi:hypothetical protein